MRRADAAALAFAQIRANPLRSAFTLLGIVVSVAFLVAVVAIIQGMNAYVKENIADAMIGNNTFQVQAGTTVPIANPPAQFDQIGRASCRERVSDTV